MGSSELIGNSGGTKTKFERIPNFVTDEDVAAKKAKHHDSSSKVLRSLITNLYAFS